MIKITKVTNLGNDILEVRGFDDGNPSIELVANGWISAMNNHYSADSYYPENSGINEETGNLLDGQLLPDATPQIMSEKEKVNYWTSLLQVNIPDVKISEPEVLFIDIVAQQELEAAQPISDTNISI